MRRPLSRVGKDYSGACRRKWRRSDSEEAVYVVYLYSLKKKKKKEK